MKILRVIASMDPTHGGPCQGLRNSIPQLEQLGVRSEVVCLDEPGAVFLGVDSFPIHAIGRGGKGWHYNAKLYPWLIENLSRFDAVIVHGLWLYHSYAVAKAVRHLRKKGQNGKQKGNLPKVFVMPHGMLDPYFQKAPERRLKAVRNWIYYKLVESKVINEAEGLLFTCEGELQLASVPFRPYKPKRELNVGYGIAEPPAYKPSLVKTFVEKCPFVESRPYLLFLSRIHQKKGVDLLIQAYHQVYEQQLSSTPMKEVAGNRAPAPVSQRQTMLPALVIAGPGLETPYGQKMQQMVKDHGLSHSVFFPGMLTGDDKWGAFHGCEAFILPSHQENFGIVVAEALACRKPVLISNQINIYKEIEAAGAGLVAGDTLLGTQELMKQWFNMETGEKEKMSQQARACYEANFAIGPAACRMLKALRV